MNQKDQIFHRSPLNRRSLLLGGLALAGTGTAARAAEEAPVLTVHGAIAGGSGESRKFKLSELMAIERRELTTKTPWDGKEIAYAGIGLQALYTAVGGFGALLRLRALNDFTASITLAEIKQYNPIAAWEREGKLMPIEDKGPLFVLFPFSARPELWNEEIFAKCVWQLSDIEIGD